MVEANQVVVKANESMAELTVSMEEISAASNETSKIIRMHKTGLIANEHIKSILPSVTNDIDKSQKSFSFLEETRKNKYSQNSEISISHREIEILELIGEGMIAKEIAQKLNISLSTVITHRKNLLSKFHVQNTAELIKLTTKLMLI